MSAWASKATHGEKDTALVLFAVLLSGVVVETVLTALRVVVPIVVVNVCTLLWPGVRVPTVKGFDVAVGQRDLVGDRRGRHRRAAATTLALLNVTVPVTTERVQQWQSWARRPKC